jgi:hypothetical protein
MQWDDTARSDARARLTARTDFGDCWLIVDGKLHAGYFSTTFLGRRTRAHVMGWFIATGRWPEGDDFVCHTCDIGACWRNDDIGINEVDGVHYERRGHHRLGTRDANIADKIQKGRQSAGETHRSHLHPELNPRGSGHGRSKLNEAQIQEIVARCTAGESRKDVARAFSVHVATVGYIMRGQTWRHVE